MAIIPTKTRWKQMKKYYDATVESWRRIAVVEWHEEGADEYMWFGDEIEENELPIDFSKWAIYTQFAQDNRMVKVVSPGGA